MEYQYKIFFALSAETKQVYFNTRDHSPRNGKNGKCYIDSDNVFYLTVSDTSIILRNKEIKENRHKDSLSKFFSKINLYCKLLNFIAMQWSRKTNLIKIMNKL